MHLSQLLTKDLASRLPLTKPSEPPSYIMKQWAKNGIYIGKTLYFDQPFFWNPKFLINPHVAVVGITGSGKSYLVKTVITRASLMWGANALILDWTGEYRTWVEHVGGTVIDVGKESINILDREGEEGQKVSQLLQAFDILIELDKYPKAKVVVQEALETIFKHNKKRRKRKPCMKDLIDELEKRKKKAKESEKKDINMALALLKRIYLQGKAFFSSKTSFSMDKLMKGLVCVDLHNLPTEEIRTLVGMTILQYVKEKMRSSSKEERDLPNLILVLDEAWKLASDERSDVIAIVREGRKYNFSVIVATQNPTDVHQAILSNVGSVFVFKLILKKYREMIKSSLNYTDVVDQQISSFPIGRCFVRVSPKQYSKCNNIIIKRVVGEDFLTKYTIINERRDDVIVEFDRERFIRTLYDLGLNHEDVAKIKEAFDRNDGELDAIKFLESLENLGFSRSKLLTILRELGMKDKQIVEIFALLRAKQVHERKGTGVTLILE